VNFTVRSFGFVTVKTAAHRSPVTVQPSRSIAKSGCTWSGNLLCQTRLQCAVGFANWSSVAWKSGAHSERYVLIPKPLTLHTLIQAWAGVSHCVASATVYPSARRSWSVAALAALAPSRVTKSAATIAADVRCMVLDLLVGRAVPPAVSAVRGLLVGARPYTCAAAVCN
jgi:hypothetical protein